MSLMFSKDILFPFNEQSLFFFPKKINKELQFLADILFPLFKQSLFFFPSKINIFHASKKCSSLHHECILYSSLYINE